MCSNAKLSFLVFAVQAAFITWTIYYIYCCLWNELLPQTLCWMDKSTFMQQCFSFCPCFKIDVIPRKFYTALKLLFESSIVVSAIYYAMANTVELNTTIAVFLCSQCLYSLKFSEALTTIDNGESYWSWKRRLKIHNHRKGPCHRLLLVESPSPLWLLHWKPLKPNFRSAYRGFRPALVEAFSMIVNFAKVCFQL